jgi:hypothetical protein
MRLKQEGTPKLRKFAEGLFTKMWLRKQYSALP